MSRVVPAAFASAVFHPSAPAAHQYSLNAARAVSTIDPGFRPGRSWRAILGWSNEGTIGSLWNNSVTIDDVYSLNLGQASTLDLNFAGVPRFTIGGESGRPVYVSPSSIVGATGSTSPVNRGTRQASAERAIGCRISGATFARFF